MKSVGEDLAYGGEALLPGGKKRLDGQEVIFAYQWKMAALHGRHVRLSGNETPPQFSGINRIGQDVVHGAGSKRISPAGAYAGGV